MPDNNTVVFIREISSTTTLMLYKFNPETLLNEKISSSDNFDFKGMIVNGMYNYILYKLENSKFYFDEFFGSTNSAHYYVKKRNIDFTNYDALQNVYYGSYDINATSTISISYNSALYIYSGSMYLVKNISTDNFKPADDDKPIIESAEFVENQNLQYAKFYSPNYYQIKVNGINGSKLYTINVDNTGDVGLTLIEVYQGLDAVTVQLQPINL